MPSLASAGGRGCWAVNCLGKYELCIGDRACVCCGSEGQSAYGRFSKDDCQRTATPTGRRQDKFDITTVFSNREECLQLKMTTDSPKWDWFQNRVNDLVQLFPAVSAPPRVPLYQDDQADAIARFGEQCPLLRAALCRGLLSGRFDGPMLQLQEYVAVGWRFAGMKHVHLILEFLSGRNSWVLDVIPELRARGDRLQAFLKAYHDLGADGPYMKLLHLPEAATTLRKHLGLHVAAAYALAILEDEHWLHYKGVPRDKDEEHVLQKITTIKRMALGAPRPDLDGSGDSGDA